MTEKKIMLWIKANMQGIIEKAIVDSRKWHPDHPYTTDWIAGIIMREVGVLINKHATVNTPVNQMWSLMRGDYAQRKGEEKPQYHGYGPMQADTGSYPEFIKSGDWKDPYKAVMFGIDVLEEKRKYLTARVKPGGDPTAFERAITAAYNTGQGNVMKSINNDRDVDYTTHQRNYSAEVFRFRKLYLSLN